ncbi:MAG: O-antigen ligase family protein [FCB group bacterium]|nr:O-antigen ligase family protein [FCB group bacterium]
MKAEKAVLILTWIGLMGYALFAPASIAISQMFFGLALAGFIGYIAATPDRKNLFFLPRIIIAAIIVYVALHFVSMVVAGTDLLMIKEDWLFLMMIVGAVMFRDIKRLTRLLDVFATGLIIMGGYGIWQHFVGVDLYHQVLLDYMTFGYRAIGNFSTYLTFSGFFAISSIFMVAVAFSATVNARKYYYLSASQIALVCILFNYSRSTIIALVIGIIALVMLIDARYRKWVSLALLLTLAAGVVISPDFLNRFKNIDRTEFKVESANSRISIWKATLVMIEAEPLTGVGPGNFKANYINYRENRTGRELSHAHNDILNVAAESGLPCMVAFGLMWLLILLYLYKGYRRCPEGFQKGLLLGALLASLVFMVMAQFEAFFADEEVRLLLMFIWGIGLAVLGNMKASERLSEIA